MADWTDKQIAKLTKLWNEGFPTTEIGKKLGISKNAVVGKAHRLGLPARVSPIRGKAAKEPTIIKPSAESPSPATKKSAKESKPTPKAPASTPKAEIKPGKTESKNKPLGLPLLELSSDMCCWPVDGEGEIQLFCGRRIFKNKPYCLEHCIIAYTGASGTEVKEPKPDTDGDFNADTDENPDN